MENNASERIWSEQDFAELYQQPPKIQTTQTYNTLHFILDSDQISIKIPSGANEENYKYLISKSIFYFYLNKKIQNPMLQTVNISMYETMGSFLDWYQLWMSGESLKKCRLVYGINYSDQMNIGKFKPLAAFNQKQSCLRIMCRSRKDGGYYNISIVQKQFYQSQDLELLQDNFKQQHPFIAHLCQFHSNPEFSYFTFEHHPFFLNEVLKQNNQPLTKTQKLMLFNQLLSALTYLDQQTILNWRLKSSYLHVSQDGHLIVGEQALSFINQDENKDITYENKIKTLLQIFGLCIQNNASQSEKSFHLYLQSALVQKRLSLKDILSHSYVKNLNLTRILSKISRVCTPRDFKLSSDNNLIEVSRQIIDHYFATPLEKYFNHTSFQSYKITPKTIKEEIIEKYIFSYQVSAQGTPNQNIKNAVNYAPQEIQLNLKRTNSSISIHHKRSKKLDSTLKLSEYKKSPYAAVLKKQPLFQRSKNVMP